MLTFCSRRQPSIVCQEICLETDKVCDLVLSAGIEMAGLAGQALRSNKDSPGGDAPIDGSVRWQALGGMSTCGLAYVSELGGDRNGGRSLSQRPDELATHHSFRAEPRQRYRLRQITSVVPGVSHGQPEMQASRLVAMARHQGFDVLRSGQPG